MFIRNVVWLSADYTTFHSRRYNSANPKAKMLSSKLHKLHSSYQQLQRKVITAEDTQHTVAVETSNAMFSHELQSALMLTVEFSKGVFTR
jgi:hypothetical protein